MMSIVSVIMMLGGGYLLFSVESILLKVLGLIVLIVGLGIGGNSSGTSGGGDSDWGD